VFNGYDESGKCITTPEYACRDCGICFYTEEEKTYRHLELLMSFINLIVKDLEEGINKI